MKKIFFILLAITFQAKAWQLNPSFNLSNVAADNCIASNVKVGEKIPSATGKDNYSIVKSIAGTSTRCQVAATPILATVEMIFGAKSKLIIEVPDEYKEQTINDVNRINGTILASKSDKSSYKELWIYFRQRDLVVTPDSIMQATINGMQSFFKDPAEIKNPEELIINGMKAWRYEVIGTGKSIFAPKITYQLTMLEGDNEYVILNATTKTDNYENEKQEMYSYAYKVSGIKSNSNPDVSVEKLKTTVEEAKGKCRDLGFKDKTEKFGSCVLKILK